MYYTINNGQNVQQKIREILQFYTRREVVLYHLLLDCGLTSTQIARKMVEYGLGITPRAITIAIERHPEFLIKVKPEHKVSSFTTQDNNKLANRKGRGSK